MFDAPLHSHFNEFMFYNKFVNLNQKIFKSFWDIPDLVIVEFAVHDFLHGCLDLGDGGVLEDGEELLDLGENLITRV